MAKQVIWEVVEGNDLVVLVNKVEAKLFFAEKNKGKFPQSYDDPDLVGKKEYEEVTVGNVTKYWINVPDEIDVPKREYVDQAKLRWQKKKARKFYLIAQKKARMMRYANLIATGQEIEPTGDEINDALALAKMEGRKPNLLKLLGQNN